MVIEKAEYSVGKLILTTPAAEAMKWLYQFKEGKNYDIKLHTDKRSNNANAYAWVLMTMISQKTGTPVDEVYRHEIENIGGVQQVISIRYDAAKEFIKVFIADHIARKAECLGYKDGFVDLLLTYGSSDYNKQQMTQLIESILEDCRALEIETKPQEYIDSLLENWHEE